MPLRELELSNELYNSRGNAHTLVETWLKKTQRLEARQFHHLPTCDRKLECVQESVARDTMLVGRSIPPPPNFIRRADEVTILLLYRCTHRTLDTDVI